MSWVVVSGAANPSAVSLVAAFVSISSATPSLRPCLRAAIFCAAEQGLLVCRGCEGQGPVECGRGRPLKCASTLYFKAVYLFFERLQLVLVSAWDLCFKMAAIGLLANHTHVHIFPHHNIVLEAIKPDARAALRDPFMRTILPSSSHIYFVCVLACVCASRTCEQRQAVMECHPLQINFAHVCHKYSALALLLSEHLDPANTVVVRTCAFVVPQSLSFVMEYGLQLRFDEPCWTSVDVGLKKGCYFSNLPKLVLGEMRTIIVLE